MKTALVHATQATTFAADTAASKRDQWTALREEFEAAVDAVRGLADGGGEMNAFFFPYIVECASTRHFLYWGTFLQANLSLRDVLSQAESSATLEGVVRVRWHLLLKVDMLGQRNARACARACAPGGRGEKVIVRAQPPPIMRAHVCSGFPLKLHQTRSSSTAFQGCSKCWRQCQSARSSP